MKTKRNNTVLLPLLFIFCIKFAFSFTHQADGIILQPEKVQPTDADLIKIQICDENIIRVLATRGKSFSTRPSLMVNNPDWKPVPWFVTEKGDYLVLSTSKVNVHIHKQKGTLAFYDTTDHLLLQEKTNGSKIITPDEVMGERTYHIQQLFHSPADEAFYGLGQHQNGIMNYKGHDVDLWQYNCVAVIPFLISSKNYGILWDNNSHTKFGDIREYQSLAGLKLYDKEGHEGGLTAEYFKTRDFQSLFTSRSEPRIEHAFSDVNDPYPDGFRRNVQSIRWSGEMEAAETGIHKFRFYCSGFTKIWLNGKLVVDNWRQNWMPWIHFPKLHMEAGKRYALKIEWIHSGGYIDFKYLPPAEAHYDNMLSLYSHVADQIEYYFIYGSNPDTIISGYRAITGKAPMMPKWAMGLWQCRERYRSQEELLSVVKEFRKRGIPLDNIVQDWFYWPEDQWGSHDFDTERYPDPVAMVNELHEQLHTRIMISVWPKFYVGTDHYIQFNENGWLYQRNVEKKQRDWVGPGYVSTFYDPYDEEARILFWQQINAKLFSKGFDAWWLDATEPDIQSNLSLPEWHLRMGPTALGSAERYLNTYSLMNARGIYEQQRATNPDQRVFILTRSAYAGQQRYAAATWSGDIGTTWDDLKNQIPAGLNFCIAGIPYWTTDIGGFAVEPRFERNVKEADLEEWRELNTRWFQFAAFCPLFRVHGQYPYREMFHIAPEDHPAYQTMLSYDKLRYRLMPYIYSLTGMVTLNDYTIMRALIMDFGNDTNVYQIGDQFMFGPAILVNPVTTYQARSRRVYLPAGTNWYNLKTSNYFKGGQTIEADAPYSDIPLFVREGSILPFGPPIEYTDKKPADPIRLMVYTGRDGAFTLYEDEHINYNYEQGAYSLIPISYQEKERVLTIGERQGEFPGMLERRTFQIVRIDKKTARTFNLEAPPDQFIAYEGKKVTVTLK
jgi:alpha-D-xyloside xylohydrolase